VAGRIRREDVDAVRERTDIVLVVSGYLQLKRASRDSLVGLCPFHAEKTPSFSVSPGKQVYYCFGCGEGGNVFRFLEKIESLSFGEAVERLAKDAGVTLRYEGQTEAGKRSEGKRPVVYRAIAEAGRQYQRMLLDGREAEEARRYVASRGIGAETIEQFGVGYAPGYPDFLLRRMSKDYTADVLLEAGLVASDSSGARRDRFRGRVMFPIHDVSGNAVGFGGRLIPGPHASANAPKYVNSPDGPVYHKGSLLYNLNRAKVEITRSGRAFLVEGYTDVIGLAQAGVPAAVATCGTALGEDHIRLLSRFAERLVLAFDSDEAGARAAERAFQFHQRYPVQLSVLVLPEGQDPADFVLANGGEAFIELADTAVPLVAYMLDRTLRDRSLTGIEERSGAVRAGLSIVAALEDPVTREEYARRLAGRVGESENAVFLELQRVLASRSGEAGPSGNQAVVAAPPARIQRARMAPEEEVEWEVLKLLVQDPFLCEPWAGRLHPDWFVKASHRKTFEVILEAREARPTAPVGDVVALAQETRGEQVAKLLAALAVEPPRAEGEPGPQYAERLFLRLEEFSLKRRADVIRTELERVNPVKAPTEHERLFEELIALEGARRLIRSQAESAGSLS
jgi:DNA primase